MLPFPRMIATPMATEMATIAHTLDSSPVLVPESTVLIDALQLDQQLVHVEGLHQVVVGPFLEGRYRLGDVGKGRHQDDLGRGRLLAHRPEEGQAVHLRQPHVADHDVVDALLDLRYAGRAIRRHMHPVASVAEHLLQRIAELLFVFDQ